MLNQQDILIIRDNVINVYAVVVMLGLILIVFLIQFVFCTEIKRAKIRELRKFKQELLEKKKLRQREKRKEYYEREYS